MKLLFDQNISFRIIKKIIEQFPNSSQVKILGLENATDISIWKYAKEHDYTIITFDADFIDLTTLRGHPPKIIWLRIGNTTTDSIAKILIEKQGVISSFIQNPEMKEIAYLEII